MYEYKCLKCHRSSYGAYNDPDWVCPYCETEEIEDWLIEKALKKLETSPYQRRGVEEYLRNMMDASNDIYYNRVLGALEMLDMLNYDESSIRQLRDIAGKRYARSPKPTFPYKISL